MGRLFNSSHKPRASDSQKPRSRVLQGERRDLAFLHSRKKGSNSEANAEISRNLLKVKSPPKGRIPKRIGKMGSMLSKFGGSTAVVAMPKPDSTINCPVPTNKIKLSNQPLFPSPQRSSSKKLSTETSSHKKKGDSKASVQAPQKRSPAAPTSLHKLPTKRKLEYKSSVEPNTIGSGAAAVQKERKSDSKSSVKFKDVAETNQNYMKSKSQRYMESKTNAASAETVPNNMKFESQAVKSNPVVVPTEKCQKIVKPDHQSSVEETMDPGAPLAQLTVTKSIIVKSNPALGNIYDFPGSLDDDTEADKETSELSLLRQGQKKKKRGAAGAQAFARTHTNMFETTRRTTLPYRVHQLWDCIQHTTAGTASLDIEKLVSIASAIHKIPRDELNTDLQSAIKDGLIISEVTKNKGVESEVYSLPDPDVVNKGDHDWYCFKCHLGGPVVQCEDCPRVFHMTCLEEDRKPQQDLFVCPPCHFIATKPSMEKVNIKQKQLNTLLTYICDRIQDWKCGLLDKLDAKVWATASHRAEKEAWRLNHFVYMPMDMSMITGKTAAGKYTSLEEFQVDCETLVHAIGCFFGSDLLKGVGIGGAFYRDVIHDINEIKLCHDCFRRSNEKDHPWWFCLPCATEHSVVWAKQAGYPYWPAKVMKQDGNKYDVRYFGGSYERGMVDAKNIMPIETSLTNLKVRKTAAWTEAHDELQKFMDIAKDATLIDKLPARGKATPGKTDKRKSGVKSDEVVAKKSRVSETAKPASTPKGRPPLKGSATAGTTPKTPKPTSIGTPQSNGMSTLKKNVATPKPAAHGAGEPANAAVATPVLVLAIEPVLTEFESELKTSFARDYVTGAASSASGAAEDGDGVPKVAENTVSSSCNESQSAVNPMDEAAPPVKELGEAVLATLAKYTDILTEKYHQDISAVKRKQWCFNCEREAIYHCCWNTAYCSTACQQLHWTKEHKRLCRRFKRDRHGNLLQNQPSGDDF